MQLGSKELKALVKYFKEYPQTARRQPHIRRVKLGDQDRFQVIVMPAIARFGLTDIVISRGILVSSNALSNIIAHGHKHLFSLLRRCMHR